MRMPSSGNGASSLGLLIVGSSHYLICCVKNRQPEDNGSIAWFASECLCNSRLSVRTCAVIIPVLLRYVYARSIYHSGYCHDSNTSAVARSERTQQSPS